MSGSANQLPIVIRLQGATEAERAFTQLGNSGAASMAKIGSASDQASRQNIAAMDQMRGSLTGVTSAAQAAASSMGSFGAALASPTAAIASLTAASSAGVVQIARIGDEYTTTMNKLRAATGSVGAASAVYGQLVALSQQTGASISESAGAFVRFSVAARAIGATNGEVLQLTRTIQQAGLISGASTQEAAAGVQQLGQALASGTLQGDELRSILENMPTLAEALAGQLGVSVGQLRTMGSEGQLTSDRVFQALLRASVDINKQFTELTPTMGRAFGILGQAMVEFVGKLDQALGLSQAIARAASAAAAAVGNISRGVTPRSPGEQAEFDVSEAQRRQGELTAEMERLRTGAAPASRRGSISRGFQETAASSQDREARLAELQAGFEAENRVIAAALERRNQAHSEADDVRQAEEATAAARRAAAARTTQQAAFNATRDALDKERKAREEHATRITAIDAGLANGNTDAAGAARLRTLADQELADALRERGASAGRAAETDQELAEVGRIVADMERDRLALMRDGETVTQAVRTEAEKYAETLANLNNLLSAGAITQDTYNRSVAAADPAVKAAAEAGRRMEQENTRTTDRITGFFGDAFARAFEGTGNGFRGLMDSFKRAAISTFATIAAQAVIRPIVAPIVQGLGLGQFTGTGSGGFNLGGLFGGGAVQAATPGATTQGGGLGAGNAGGFSTLRTAYNGLTSPGGLGSFFPGGAPANTGFGFADGLLNTSLVSPTIGPAGGFPSAAGFQGLVDGTANIGNFPSAAGFQSLVDGTSVLGASTSSGLSVAGSLGPLAAIGGGAYGVYSGIQKGGIGGGLGAAGGAVSAATGIGMLGAAAGLLPALGVLGPIGLAAGAILAIAGALLPGEKASGKGQSAYVNVDSGDVGYAGLGGDRFSQDNRDASQNAAERIAALARDIGGKLGGAQFSSHVAVGTTSSRGSGPGNLYLDVAGRKAEFANDENGAKQLAETAARFVMQQFRETGAASGDYAGILNASGDSTEKLGENLQWYEQVYKAFDKTGEAADKTAVAVKAVEDQFNPLIAKAAELNLSTAKIVEARDVQIAATKKAVAEAEAARLSELASIKQTIQARLNASDTAATYEARLLSGNVSRTQAWQVELKALEDRLVALGNATEDTAAQVAALTTAQAAEFWANFATSMDDLDRNVTTRILRAQGRTGDANRIDFDAASTAQIKNLTTALADLGVSADIAAIKIGETQQAIDAERIAAANDANDKILALDRSNISRILRATGRADEADLADFDAAATLELKGLATALDDLGFSAETIAEKIGQTEQAIGVERIALVKRIADAQTAVQKQAAAEAEAAWKQVLTAGQSVRAYIDAQRTNSGAGGVSTAQAFQAAQSQFGADLALARSGDQDAVGRITGTADRLLGAAQKQFASGVDFQAVRDFVLASLESLPVTRSYDSQILDELKKLNGGVDVEVGIAVVRTISETLNALPDSTRDQLVQAQTVLRTVEERIGRFLTPAEVDALVAEGAISRTVDQVIGRTLTAAERAGLVSAQDVIRTIEQSIGRNLTAAERAGLVADDAVSRVISQAMGRNLTAPERATLINAQDVLRTVEQTIGRNLTAAERASLVAGDDIARTVEQRIGRNLTAAERASLVAAQDVLRGIDQVIGRNLTGAERASLVAAAGIERTIEQTIGRNLTAAERAGLVNAQSVIRTVEQSIGRNLTTVERASLIATGTMKRTVEQSIGRNLTAAERRGLVEAQDVLRTVEQTIGRNLTAAERASLVAGDDIARTVEQRIGRNLTAAERASLVAAQDVLRGIDQVIGRNLTGAERASLVAAADIERTIEQTIGRNLTAAERAGLVNAQSVVRTVEQSIGRNLTAAERAMIVLPGGVSRLISQGVTAPRGAPLITAGNIDRTIKQSVETTETVQISRSIDDKLGKLLNDQIVIGRTQVTILGQINADTNNLWKAAAGVGQPGLLVNSTAWSHGQPGAQIIKFAQGGVFDSPVTFPMRGGQIGMLGEAGPEAIMPLERGAGGRLGVRASGGMSDAVARAFDRMASEIAALRGEVQRLLRAGERTASATESTAESNARMVQRDAIVGRRMRAA